MPTSRAMQDLHSRQPADGERRTGESRSWASRMKSMGFGATLLACFIALSACSGGADASHDLGLRPGHLVRPSRTGRVLLIPSMSGGTAGWCMATINADEAGCGLPGRSAGPILDYLCTTGGRTSGEGHREPARATAVTTVYVLTRAEASAVSVGGGRAIKTTRNSTLPDGFRAAVVEVVGPVLPLRERLKHLCPRIVALDASGEPLLHGDQQGILLATSLPTVHWEAPAASPAAACRLTVSRLPAETVPLQGTIAKRIRAIRGLVGRAYLSCAEATYVYNDEHHLPAAVLLDARHPGTRPAPLPDMTRVPGHPGIFEAPGAEGRRVARRIPSAWLVVEEEDKIGLDVPIHLLEYLHASLRL